MTSRQALHLRRKREALREKGLVQCDVWAYPEDVPAIKAFADELVGKREAAEKDDARRGRNSPT